ncbi:MAG: KamA family radical SAM protein [Phycisphaeraceae bacterium]|nr:KamA family radical SAM protein [Phycisphaeraceae bacterium]
MDIVDPLPGARLASSPSNITAKHVKLLVLEETMSDAASCENSRETGSDDDEPPSTPRLNPPPPPPIHATTRTFSEHMTAREAAEASRADGFVQSERTRRFRARVFPDATDAQWNDWKWQLRMRIRDLETLQRAFTLSTDERDTVTHLGGQLPVGITPYYASLIDPEDADDPIRRTMVPTGGELLHTEQEAEDPLNEDGDMPVEGLVHRYPDRVLFLVTSFCATYCRYCTRSRLVGKTGEYHFNTKQFERALAYIEATPEIRDVLISGGDPLTMNDDKIDWLLTRLRAIPHVEFIRIGSKIPAVLPQRITPNLVSILQKCHPFWMSVHFMHPREVTPEVAQSCGRLVNAGIPLGSQTVLLKGTNDNPETMKSLMHNLLKIRVRPYYIYQCDPIPGSSHFRTPVETGLKIIEALRGHTTGYAVPQYVIDGPGGGGKIPLAPEYVVGREGDELLLRNYEGKIFRYPDPISLTTPVREKITV